MSNLVEHAKRELELAGVEHDVRPSIISAISCFASYGHSGGSASIVIPMINDLLNFRNISPLTDDPSEWMRVGDEDTLPIYQSTRRADAFSNDGGRTYYCLDEPKARDWLGRKRRRVMHASVHAPRNPFQAPVNED